MVSKSIYCVFCGLIYNDPLKFGCTVYENHETGTTYIDSDTGLESMSSAEAATTKACSVCLEESVKTGGSAGGSAGGSVSPDTMMIGGGGVVVSLSEAAGQIDGLTQEVTQLKNDKLHLLQENVVCVAPHTNHINQLNPFKTNTPIPVFFLLA